VENRDTVRTPRHFVKVFGLCSRMSITKGMSLQPGWGCLKHDPEKWNPVFRKDHAPPKS
jgi:hypothetical protein